MRVLIADDDAVSRRLLQALAEKSGFDVALVTNGEDALRSLSEADGPQLAILDWMMPGIDGLEVCRRIRESRHDRYIYLLVLTSRKGGRDVVDAMQAGADDFVVKPFDAAELDARLRVGRRILDLEERLRTSATRDALTGLWNRGAIRGLLDQQISRARRGALPLTAMLIDIDHFKQINDSHGHPVGDEVLRAVAKRTSSTLRIHDFLGRDGGEEFLVILPDVEPPKAVIAAERVRRSIEGEPVVTAAGAVAVTASIGVACVRGGLDADALVKLADDALYRAKREGRNRVVA
jgi:diguanylate cyclase (GGDEF)-like protein